MSFKGTASKSASGASMSKYDVEVEARLQALEKFKVQARKKSNINRASLKWEEMSKK